VINHILKLNEQFVKISNHKNQKCIYPKRKKKKGKKEEEEEERK
jgi:hypothetical protein